MISDVHPNAFPVRQPVFVKPLSANEIAILQQHGCNVEPFPQNRPDILKGHMVTFPCETTMNPDATNTEYVVHFPDGYSPRLIWQEGSYYLYPEEVMCDQSS